MINTSDNVWNNSKNMKNDIKISHKTPLECGYYYVNGVL